MITALSTWCAVTAAADAAADATASVDNPSEDRELTCAEARSWVQLSFAGPVSPALQSAVLRDLSAGLPRMVVCLRGPASGSPVSTVIVERKDHRVTIEVRDAITDKRLSRDLDLAPLPEDGHALALAVAADELLRASWAELALRQRPRSAPRPPPPPEVDATVQDALTTSPRPSDPQVVVGVRGAGERYGTGLALFGAEVVVSREAAPWFVEGWLGARQGLEVPSTLGTIESELWLAGLAVGRDVVRAGVLRLGPVLGVQGGSARFTGRSQGDARASELRGALLVPRAGGYVSVESGPWRVGGELGAGMPVLGLRAREAGDSVTGMAGPVLWATLGAGVMF